MCGITGFYSKTSSTFNNAILKMNSAISHRGPDNSGLWQDKNSGIVFGHQRLSILDLSETNFITLYELDNDKEKQEKIIELIPDIRKYFSFNSIKAVGEPHRIKRPWLSIIKQITKLKYTITTKDHRIKMGDKVERTILYRIIPLSNENKN